MGYRERLVAISFCVDSTNYNITINNLYVLEYPSILNCACGKNESSFVSDSINISILSLTNGTKNSNLFRNELTLRWLIISLSGFLFLRSIKKFDLHNLIEAIEFKDESAEIFS